MKIVAFMQNPWFPPGTAVRHIHAYRDDQKFHQRLLVNTMSGKRLHFAFGGDLFEKIWWDNANWRPAWMPSGKQPADLAHMARVIDLHEPELVLTFGNEAKLALTMVQPRNFETMHCHHPNARFRTQDDLNAFAHRVRCHIHERTRCLA